VRRVDDPLLLPRAPGVRAGRGERDSDLVGELVELPATLAEPRRGLLEGVGAAGADLHLGGDQLADQVLLERCPLRGRLQVFEAIRQVQRLGIEDGELLLDRDGEVLRGFELLAREGELLGRD